MGGDASPDDLYRAVESSFAPLPDCQFTFFCPPNYLPLTQLPVTYEICSQTINMDDAPLTSVRKKPDSSLVKGVRAVKDKKLDAFLSCGNTGAFIAAAAIYLDHLPGIARPALLARFPSPSRSGSMAVLDVGGNIAAKAEQLVQFARLGSAYHQSRYREKKPKLALLNIGTESEKGTKELREAYRYLEMMQDAPFIFVGNVEPQDVFSMGVDVLVTSGFAGNIFLKTAEGIATFVMQLAEKQLEHQAAQAAVAPFLHELKSTLYDEASKGALVAGVDGVLIKCHGRASQHAIANAIMDAHQMVEQQLIAKMRNSLTT